MTFATIGDTSSVADSAPRCAGWLSVHAPAGRDAKTWTGDALRTGPASFTDQGSRAGDGRWPMTEPSASPLPRTERVLAVIARPGQESASLGGLLYALRKTGASVSLLSLTRGEASELNSTPQPLSAVRPWELQLAAFLLGVSTVAVSDYPDGRLSGCELTALTERVHRAIRLHSPDLLLVVDPADADADSAMAAMAACAAADQAGLPVMARTLPAADGSWQVSLGAESAAARAAQRSAAAAHRSQSDGMPDLMWQLDLLGSEESLRYVVPPTGARVPVRRLPERQRPGREVPNRCLLPGEQLAGSRAVSSPGAGGLVPRQRTGALRPL
jgi:N-acetylglucosamine malate deacetylase 2